jgi:hypothetical protein
MRLTAVSGQLTALLSVGVFLINKSNCYQDDPLLYGQFPEGFSWSLATSSYQIEGGYREDGN